MYSKKQSFPKYILKNIWRNGRGGRFGAIGYAINPNSDMSYRPEILFDAIEHATSELEKRITELNQRQVIDNKKIADIFNIICCPCCFPDKIQEKKIREKREGSFLITANPDANFPEGSLKFDYQETVEPVYEMRGRVYVPTERDLHTQRFVEGVLSVIANGEKKFLI